MEEGVFQSLHENFQRLKKLQKLEHPKKLQVAKETLEEIANLTKQMTESIENLWEHNESLKLRLLAMKGSLSYEQSKFLLGMKQENIARAILMNAFNEVERYISETEMVFLVFRIINHYAYFLIKEGAFDKAKSVLELAESTYKSLKKKYPVSVPSYTTDDLFSPQVDITPSATAGRKLEHLVTNNLQMQAFIYYKQELHDKFVEYYHEILKRQVKEEDCDVKIWAVQSAKLASYFIGKCKFREARHHLAAAVHVLQRYEDKLKNMETSDNTITKWIELQCHFAQVAKSWVKYGLVLFAASRQTANISYNVDSNNSLERNWTQSMQFPVKGETSNASNAEQCLQKEQFLMFESLNVTEIENQVTDTLIETITEARTLFSFTHSWLQKVQGFYTLQSHPIEYVNAILDLSELCRYLSLFETDIESRYSVQKLRAEALENTSAALKETRSYYYVSMSVELLRELTEVHLEMMELNLKRLYAVQQPLSRDNDMVFRKMEALSDIHVRLERFHDNMEQYPLQKNSYIFTDHDVATNICNWSDIV